MKVRILFLLFLLDVFFAFGQHTISGKIIDITQKPIEFATISVCPISDTLKIKYIITDEKGMFHISELEKDNYNLVVQMLGFQDVEKRLYIDKKVILGEITLQEDIQKLDEVEITATTSILENRLGKKILRIGQDLTTTGSSALEAMERIPSVTTTRQGGLQIRGSSNIIIYINGKETTRDASTLQYIPAEVLEKIEVITNPSAKYDAEGVAGIVNIIYKRNKKKPIKIDAIGTITIPLRLRGGVSASYNRNLFSFFFNGSLGYNEYKTVDVTQRTNENGVLRSYENGLTYNAIGKRRVLEGGVSYQPDSTLSVDFELNYDRWNDDSSVSQENTFVFEDPGENVSLSIFNRRKELEDEVTLSLSLTKDFEKKKKLQLFLIASGEDEDNSSRFDDLQIPPQLPDGDQLFLKSTDETESQRLYQIKLDYETPFFGFGKLETGIKVDNIRYEIFQNVVFQDNGNVLPDNKFSIKQEKYALYAIHKKSFEKFEYGVGARIEHFLGNGFQQSNQERFKQENTGIFPSVQLQYNIKERKQTLGFTYSRKINRPGFFDINPYVSFNDPLNLSTGNPDLDPEFASILELTYHLQLGTTSLDITGFYRQTDDIINRVIQQLGNNQTLETLANFDKRMNQGIEGQVEYNPKGIFKTFATFNLFHTSFNDDENNVAFNNTTTWRLRFSQELRFKNNWIATFSENVRGPRFGAQSKTEAQTYMDVGLAKKFKNGKGNISLNFRDIFNSRNYNTVIQGEGFRIENHYKWQTRTFSLGLKYTILE